MVVKEVVVETFAVSKFAEVVMLVIGANMLLQNRPKSVKPAPRFIEASIIAILQLTLRYSTKISIFVLGGLEVSVVTYGSF